MLNATVTVLNLKRVIAMVLRKCKCAFIFAKLTCCPPWKAVCGTFRELDRTQRAEGQGKVPNVFVLKRTRPGGHCSGQSSWPEDIKETLGDLGTTLKCPGISEEESRPNPKTKM